MCIAAAVIAVVRASLLFEAVLLTHDVCRVVGVLAGSRIS